MVRDKEGIILEGRNQVTGYIQDIYKRLLISQLDRQAIQARSTLILALDQGHPALERCHIQGGARCLQQTTAKLTACDVAHGNFHARHPRKPNFVRDDYSNPLGI